ncbi:MAG: DUF354 domain-containing protein [Pyrinomonadaceae bacterium]
MPSSFTFRLFNLLLRIWVDLANAPHVPFFQTLIKEFGRRGHECEVTAREFAQTVELAERANLNPVVIGSHGGGRLRGKAENLFGRARSLRKWARGRSKFDLAVSHNSYAQVVAARSLGIKTVTLMDYEHQPANHLAFRLASRVVVPRFFPEDALRRFGARESKVRHYDGIKEDVYLADFEPDPNFAESLRATFGVEGMNVFVVARPPARDALYHRFDNELFDELVEKISCKDNAKIMILARGRAQREALAARHQRENVLLPTVALDGANLIAAADLVVSAGGTMNREAAALGTPAWTIFAGRPAAIDEALAREGRLRRISTREDLRPRTIEKKSPTSARRALGVRAQVADLILE